jgi:hypothetical protein
MTQREVLEPDALIGSIDQDQFAGNSAAMASWISDQGSEGPGRTT